MRKMLLIAAMFGPLAGCGLGQVDGGPPRREWVSTKSYAVFADCAFLSLRDANKPLTITKADLPSQQVSVLQASIPHVPAMWRVEFRAGPGGGSIAAFRTIESGPDPLSLQQRYIYGPIESCR